MTTPPSDLTAGAQLEELATIMARLRDPNGGCPWDLEQTFETIAPYTIEEAYEVADAIARGDLADLKGELGDLLLQVVFHARIAEEDGAFTLMDVVTAINTKMLARHPHVFGEGAVRSAAEQTVAWEALKAAERAAKSRGSPVSALDGVALGLPALLRAQKLQHRAARDGFDWPGPEPILEKLAEEAAELSEAVNSGDAAHIAEEVGDLLFVAVNLARKLNLDAETCLRDGNAKFERRYRAMEALARADSVAFGSLSLEAQESLWRRVKAAERG
jgi:MazG family protein